MNDNKSAACDSVPIKYLKMANLIIAPILSYFINLCINQGCFFNYIKIAQVIPILGLVKMMNPCNYHSISLLNPVCKIFEKYLYEQLNQYFVKYNYLLKTQFGF